MSNKDLAHHITNYRKVFIYLLIGTALTVGASYVEFNVKDSIAGAIFVGLTIATLERINITVLNVACGMVSFKRCIIEPCSPIGGHTGAPVRSNMYAEKSPPKSIISDAKKSHIPSLELYNPVSSLSSTLYGISILYISLINFGFVE